MGLRAWALAALVVACRVPREVHEPRVYPATKLQSSHMSLALSDPRPAPTDPTERQLLLPASFEGLVRARLDAMVSGSGPALDVSISVAALDELEIVDARGEMTRVLVRFDVVVAQTGGPVLRRAETESRADLPRDEATPEEVAFLLDSTAIDAFDRYFADEHWVEALNVELAARSAAP